VQVTERAEGGEHDAFQNERLPRLDRH
jgi:hypothetical protein